MAVTNRSCEYLPSFLSALHAHDVDGTLRWFSDGYVYDDRRRLSGDPVVGPDAMRAAIERIFAQYTRFDIRVLAVRGQRSHLLWTRWSDDDGNETTTFYVNETGDDGRLTYHGRFDEDDFEGAYREFERRYLAGEGVAFAEAGSVGMEWFIALNRGDLDRAFGELMAPERAQREPFAHGFSGSLGQRSRHELRRPECHGCVDADVAVGAVFAADQLVRFRLEREAVGRDGETYAWTWLTVSAVREGRFVSSCFFDPEDEEAAFAYAEERMRATASRLAVTNRASADRNDILSNAMRDHDVDGATRLLLGSTLYMTIVGASAATRSTALTECGRLIERVCAQYTQFECAHAGRSRREACT